MHPRRSRITVPEVGAAMLGPCCTCGTKESVRSVIMIHLRAPEPGKGWGCMTCGLPPDGAVAVQCDACRGADKPIEMVCVGYPKEGVRCPLQAIPTDRFDHDMSKHPEVTS